MYTEIFWFFGTLSVKMRFLVKFLWNIKYFNLPQQIFEILKPKVDLLAQKLIFKEKSSL